MVETYTSALRITFKVCVQGFRADWNGALQVEALSQRATPRSVTGYSLYFLTTEEEVVFPLLSEWRERTLCSEVRWLHALSKCRAEVLRTHELLGPANARGSEDVVKQLHPGMYAALRLTREEQQTTDKFSPLYRGP